MGYSIYTSIGQSINKQACCLHSSTLWPANICGNYFEDWGKRCDVHL